MFKPKRTATSAAALPMPSQEPSWTSVLEPDAPLAPWQLFVVKVDPCLGLGLVVGQSYSTRNLVNRCKGDFAKIARLEELLRDPLQHHFEPLPPQPRDNVCASDSTELLRTAILLHMQDSTSSEIATQEFAARVGELLKGQHLRALAELTPDAQSISERSFANLVETLSQGSSSSLHRDVQCAANTASAGKGDEEFDDGWVSLLGTLGPKPYDKFLVREDPQIGIAVQVGGVYATWELVLRCTADFSKLRRLHDALRDPVQPYFYHLPEAFLE